LHIENGKGSGAYNRIGNYYYYEIKKGMTDMIHITQHCSTAALQHSKKWGGPHFHLYIVIIKKCFFNKIIRKC
jgi:hypothetical protein